MNKNTNVDLTKIADKIQNLLNKTVANGCTEGEAQAALLLAQKLMAQYNVDQAQLTGDATLRYSLETAKVRTNPRSKRVCSIIADSFACKAILQYQKNGYKICFFGREDNAKAAKSAMEYIHRVMERGMQAACRKYGYKSTTVAGASLVYNAYADGFIRGLKEAMDAQTTALAIVVPQDVKEELAKKFPNLRTGRASTMRKGNFQDAFDQGITDGKVAMGKRSLASAKS